MAVTVIFELGGISVTAGWLHFACVRYPSRSRLLPLGRPPLSRSIRPLPSFFPSFEHAVLWGSSPYWGNDSPPSAPSALCPPTLGRLIAPASFPVRHLPKPNSRKISQVPLYLRQVRTGGTVGLGLGSGLELDFQSCDQEYPRHALRTVWLLF